MPKINLPIDTIVIHCSDSPHRGDTAKDVHLWHKQKLWAGIGYHWTINEYGLREAGRPEYWQGAHVRGHNKNSIGIMLFGKSFFTKRQIDELDFLLHEILFRHKGIKKIVGHYQLDKKKTCPNIDIPIFLESIGLQQFAAS